MKTKTKNTIFSILDVSVVFVWLYLAYRLEDYRWFYLPLAVFASVVAYLNIQTRRLVGKLDNLE